MTKKNDIRQIRAEVLLNYLYPDIKQWTARHKGTFYRNYSDDILEYDNEEATTTLSRDGFTKLIPQGLASKELGQNDIKSAAKFKQIERQRHLLEEAFLPLDNFVFNDRLQLEKITRETLNQKYAYILKQLFFFDIEQEQDRLLCDIAAILPEIRKKRGDKDFVRKLLQTIIKCKVEMKTGRYSTYDTTRKWMPYVRYNLIITGLSSDMYKKVEERLKPLCNFVIDRLMPADCITEIKIVEHQKETNDNGAMVLNYNTQL